MAAPRKNQQWVMPFAMIDSANRPARKAGLIWLAGDVQISRDGADYVAAANLPSAIGGTPTGRYKITFTAAEMDCDFFAVVIEKTGADPLDQFFQTTGQPSAQVVADAGNSAAQFKTNRTETVDYFWKDSIVAFTSGTLSGQVRPVTGYIGVTKIMTFATAFTAVPAAGDRFILINI